MTALRELGSADVRDEQNPNVTATLPPLPVDQLERLADLIADRLAARAAGELIDAAELAQRIDRSREWVYSNAAALGVVRLGDGVRPRLAFRWPHALDALTSRSRDMRSQTARSPVAAGVPTRRRGQRLGTSVDLLPIGGSEERRSGRQEVSRAD